MDQKQRIIFRADGNSRIGLGHVTRSLALVHMLQKEFECVFAIQSPDLALRERIQEVCQGVIVLPPSDSSEARFNHELDAYVSSEEIVVLDGYHFETEYQQNLKNRGAAVICIDDIHAYTFVADAVINQAGGVLPEVYQTAPYTKLLLGPAYALLRPAFLRASRATRSLPAGELRVLVCMGGADPDNHTLQALQELQSLTTVKQVEVVVGSAYSRLHALKEWLKGKPDYRLHRNLSAESMRRLMTKCHAAITSASGISYEYAAVGGLLFVKQTADNQAGMHHFLTTEGIASDYGALLQQLKKGISEVSFQKQLAAQRRHFDGRSDERLRQVFQQLGLAAGLRLRVATIDDLQLLFGWANDPAVRQHSFNPAPIPLEDHTRWFHRKLDNPDTILYIAEAGKVPAAHIRFDIQGNTATISYLIGADYRGKGLGHAILLKGVQQLLKQRPDVQLVDGLVQPEHKASVRSFEKAGFAYGKADSEHPKAHRFVLERNTKV
ncbi:UDP-2,4-diacetamido-2,4,6-trideoxy-beta-L-altropyranose hydrolase [Pontibacter sp. JH31]|uniref:UDP-2,4-diacetamido-2,4, 6-trideoxy-beta-L-altropyranose hydrolase n=1 Tax=Pontibacter aquaedesilientis TaxID=2766980 RepID=A0ABR7XHA9_9BACT|nr:UDP-2,4-diacetamido-2,4,6-trideoxy-beta-L-altropyranose hydrolase [Pontibacter aquaedesilientis]MBD1397641.1 UDP-2,4-diacetamido-2,4,6-trideoxy-beta-L-altropyranose hydrolase [Pontibacter aquaedesilientis]